MMVENKEPENKKLHKISNTNEKNNNSAAISLPQNCCPLSHQVAGHFFGKGRTKLGLLQTNDGFILKPVQSPPTGQREHDFYKHIFRTNDTDLNEDEQRLKKLLPAYLGSMIHNDGKIRISLFVFFLHMF